MTMRRRCERLVRGVAVSAVTLWSMGCGGGSQGAVPVVTGVSPETAQTLGWQSVRITGRNFRQGDPSDVHVQFGSIPAGGITVDSDSQITATVRGDAGTGAVVDVLVTNAHGTSTPNDADHFTFVGAIPAPP